MFMSGPVSILSRIAALRARIAVVGAPSEHALYARKANQNGRVSLEKPNSAKALRRTPRSLQRDSSSIICGNIYSSERF